MTQAAQSLEAHLNRELGKLMFGMEEVIHALTIALVARGHVLLEGPPGLGKTRMSKAFAQVLGGTFKRVQGTADLMPTDVTGVHIFNTQTQSFTFQQGPLFADVVLVDEINRAGPKTQSALLEAMEERQVSVDRDTFPLAEDFLLVATKNPHEFEGTFPLPESQLDRFTMSVPVQYLDREHEAQVLLAYNLPGVKSRQEASLEQLPDQLLAQARQSLDQIHLSDELLHYVLDIAAATRDSASINLGLSTRGALALTRCARIEASLRGGEFVIPDDVQRVAPWTISHRLVLTAEAAIDGVTAAQVLARLLADVPVPR
jgi:MoxR-like ATPase